MKNDIKTSSTDFLPPKPGADPAASPAANSSNPAPSAKPVAAPTNGAKPAGPPMPTSAHVIDLKSQANDAKTPKTSSDFMVKNNPFLQSTDAPPAKPVAAKPTPVAVTGGNVKSEPEMPEPPMAEPAEEKTAEAAKPEATKADAKPDAESKAADTEVTVDPTKPPEVDMAHPEAAHDENDPLKQAMVSDDAQKSAKPKKKLPTWLLVLIILVAVIVVAIGTFVLLNVFARPA